MSNDQFFSIPLDVLKLQEFNKWLSSAEARLWLILNTKIVRQESDSWLPNYVYENYYKNGKLATSWRLSALAKDMGLAENCEATISKYLTNLTKKKFIKKHAVFVKNKKINVYELGYIENKKKAEILYTYTKFIKHKNEQVLGEFYDE